MHLAIATGLAVAMTAYEVAAGLLSVAAVVLVLRGLFASRLVVALVAVLAGGGALVCVGCTARAVLVLVAAA